MSQLTTALVEVLERRAGLVAGSAPVLSFHRDQTFQKPLIKPLHYVTSLTVVWEIFRNEGFVLEDLGVSHPKLYPRSPNSPKQALFV